jgi:hypothetical protein
MFQDDVLVCKNARQYLDADSTSPVSLVERALSQGYLNLYNMPGFEEQGVLDAGSIRGWREAISMFGGPVYPGNTRPQYGKGAIALVFSREGVINLLSSRDVVRRPLNDTYGKIKLDGCIVTAFNQIGWREWVHNPGLAKHIGDQSSMGHGVYPQSETFAGEDFDCMTLLDPQAASILQLAKSKLDRLEDEKQKIQEALAADRKRLETASSPEERYRLNRWVNTYEARLRNLAREIRYNSR